MNLYESDPTARAFHFIYANASFLSGSSEVLAIAFCQKTQHTKLKNNQCWLQNMNQREL